MKNRLFGICVLMMVAWAAMAQQPDTVGFGSDTLVTLPAKDSLKLPKWLRPRQVTYTIGGDKHTEFVLDTTLDNKQYFDPAWLADFQYRNLGNLGQPVIPITYVPKLRFGFDNGLNAYDVYRYQRETLRWYDSKQPFTRLQLNIGGSQEQMVNVVHNQNIKQLFNFTFRFQRISSPGVYSRQEATHNNFALTGNFHTKKHRYGLRFGFIFNNIRNQNNGGVETTDIFSDTSIITSAIVDVRLQGAQTSLRERGFFVRQELRWGQVVKYQINDTTEGSRMYPELTFFHDVGFNQFKYLYRDTDPDTGFYSYIYYRTDSMYMRLWDTELTNRGGVSFAKVLKADSISAEYRNFYLEASVEHQYHWLEQFITDNTVQNVNVHVELRDHSKANSDFLYGLKSSYGIGGYNLGDVQLAFRGGYDMGKLGIFQIQGEYRREEPTWQQTNIHTNKIWFARSFDKQQSFTGAIVYTNKKWRTNIEARYTYINNLIYWDEYWIPFQATESMQFYTFTIQQNFRFWDMGLDNLMRVYLPTADNEQIRIPTYWGKHTLFYQKDLFKDNMRLRVGVDLFYNTDYKAYTYIPLFGQFRPQDELKLSYYPIMDVFLSFQVAELVVFLKMEHVDQGLFKDNGYFNAYPYPAQNRAFKLGLIWRFYN